MNLAILRFKNEVVASKAFGTTYSGIHHIGFQVDDAEETDARLREANSPPDDINAVLHAGMGDRHGGRNVEMKYGGPDGVMVDVSQSGWVGTDSE